MNLQSLIDTEFDDLELFIRSVSFDAEGDLWLDATYDSFLLPEGKKHIKLRFVKPKEINISVGYVGTVSQHHEHALLLNHRGPQAQVFFSSAPKSPEEIFFLAHRVLTQDLNGWREPGKYLNGEPAELFSHLVGGFGLLASGPSSAMFALAAAVNSLLAVRVIESKSLQCTAMVVTFDTQFVICEAVEVVRNDG